MELIVGFSSHPYPGLRPFRFDESDIFFGRETQIDQLLARIAANRFLTVIGPSGCGKSSLVRAGMLPALTAGFIAQVGARWRIAELRPGDSPLRHLAEALAIPTVLGPGRDTEESIAFIEATLRRGPLGLIEIVKGAQTMQGAALLVLVDQFEEIFRYREQLSSDEADAFVAQLLASCAQTETPIYIVITMRSDYLGECAVFRGLPEAVSDSQYLAPRMTRDELQLAICGPARVFGAQVDPRLQNRLLNDFGTDTDQLPLLQHALACLWSRRDEAMAAPVLTVEAYDALGGLASALSNHADEVLAELTPERQRIAQLMFRRLSGSADGRRDVRAPARVDELSGVSGASIDEVIAVADAFRRPDRCMLSPTEAPLHPDTVLDLSHESLVRQWHKLAAWSAEEAESADLYRRLSDWALRWEQGKADLWRGPDLASATAWRLKEKPTAQWAARYGDARCYTRAMKFLDASEEAHQREEAERADRKRARTRRSRWFAFGLGFAASAAAGYLCYLVAYVFDYKAYFKETLDVRGVPKGVDELSSEEVAQRNASYLVTRRGRLGPVLSVQLVNASKEPMDKQGSIQAVGDTDIERRTSRTEYVYDSKNQSVVYENYVDRNGHRIRTVVYSPADPHHPNERNEYPVSANGAVAAGNGSCEAYEAVDYSQDGYRQRVRYLDQAGRPTPDANGVFMRQYQRDAKGHVIRMTSLWLDGRPMLANDGTATSLLTRDERGNLVAAEFLDAAGRPANVKYGFSKFTCTYDDKGNCVAPALWHADGRRLRQNPTFKLFCYASKLEYDQHGNAIEQMCLTKDGNLGNGLAYAKTDYDRDGKPTADHYFDRNGRPTSGPGGGAGMRLSHDSDGNLTEVTFFDANGTPTPGNGGYHRRVSQFDHDHHEVRTEYQNGNGELEAIDGGYAAISRLFDSQGNEVQTEYWGPDGKPWQSQTAGYALRKAGFDTCGRETDTWFFDGNAKPTRSSNGYAHVFKQYDEANNVSDERYFDERGQPVRSKDGYARVARRYDRNRNVVDERYFDERDAPLALLNLYAEHRSLYNESGALVEDEFLSVSGEPVVGADGWAKQTRRYDAGNRLVEKTYLGVHGEPVANSDGIARVVYTNNQHGQETGEAYYGVDGKPVQIKEGYARQETRYDASGDIVGEAYFGTDGARTLRSDGISRITSVNNELGQTVAAALYGVHDEPVIGKGNFSYHRATWVRDQRDNVLEFATFDTDGKPLKGPEGYAKQVNRYDAAGGLVETSYFGVDGKPVLDINGVARTVYVKNRLEQDVGVTFFGADAKPVRGSHGYATVFNHYDIHGNLIEQTYADEKGQPALLDQKFARVTFVNDKLGRQVEWAYFGVDGAPANGPVKYPFHRARRVLDERNNELELAAFGIDDKPIPLLDAGNGQRCATVRRQYDAADKVNGTECVGDTAKTGANQNAPARGSRPPRPAVVKTGLN
ncbi:hypothetical protein P3T23_002479 [Paraburkholderia sp. GAS448]|uniref:ATP-binding protein n=1 Tax=Paraburkholderia sp. GAS448 TaxID=3035136 RepID=UPI003D21CBCE